MEVREIKALVGLMNEYGLVELEIEDKKGKVRLVRGRQADQDAITGGAAPAARSAANPARALPRAKAPSVSRTTHPSPPPPVELAENQVMVESPMVGTFYRAASPDSAPFVREGDSVRKGQTVCIIEAMKMMNEVEATATGRIVRFVADNGQPVEYGQPLIVIEAG